MGPRRADEGLAGCDARRRRDGRLCFLGAIDEPDVGLHPRALALLAGTCRAASERTQLIITTHSAEFWQHFDLDQIAVMRRDPNGIVLVRPNSRAGLRKEVEELGTEAIARMFASDELEARS